ncbi:MAG: hypothetical protein JWO15_3661 [Sphingomonadales bacterium]|nr:hypothetical protein [Sphingomonadales bacterium]
MSDPRHVYGFAAAERAEKSGLLEKGDLMWDKEWNLYYWDGTWWIEMVPKTPQGENMSDVTPTPGFTVVKSVPIPHACLPPRADEAHGRLNMAAGTIIQCDKCEQEFELAEEQRDGWYWKKLNPEVR